MHNRLTYQRVPPHGPVEFAIIAALLFIVICIPLGVSQLPAAADRSAETVLDQQELRGAIDGWPGVVR